MAQPEKHFKNTRFRPREVPIEVAIPATPEMCNDQGRGPKGQGRHMCGGGGPLAWMLKMLDRVLILKL